MAGISSRSWIALPWALFNTAFCGVTSLFSSIYSASRARGWGHWWGRTNNAAFGIKLRVEGLEHLPDDGGGFILASNHSSSADIWALFAGVPADICWVTKASLLKYPFVGWHLKRVHIPVARRSAGNTKQFLDDGARKIQEGATVVIFPEGTRNRGGVDLLPFKKGAFLLARASMRPIIPVAITGAEEAWPKGQLLPNKGEVLLRIGPAIDPADFPDKDLTPLADHTRDIIKAMIAEDQAAA